MKYTVLFVMIFLCASSMRADLNTEIKYGQAMQQAQQGNWESAHDRLNQLVTDNPERADVLYDSGVAAYRLKNFESAQAYFKHVTEFDNIVPELKERAHFNLGNTHVSTKQLTQAIEEYEKVLDINPDNEAAKDNIRIVKEMLEQEKQKQEEEKQKNKDQQKKDQEKKDQKKDQQQKGEDQSKDKNKKDDESQDQGQQDGQKDQQREKSSDKNKSKREQSDNGQQHGDQGEQTDNDTDRDQEKKERDEQNKTEQSDQQDKDEQERDGEKHPQRGLDDKQSQEKHDDKEQGEHGTEPSKDMSEKQLNASQGTQDQEKKQGAQQGHAPVGEKEEKNMDPHEKWIAGIMKEQEKSDAKANKAFIRQAINKGGTRQHGQKNW